MLNFIGYAAAYLSGLFFGVMIFTIIENSSKGFRQFVRRVCNAIPFLYRRIVMWVVMILMAVMGYIYLLGPWGATRAGIFCGCVAGVFIYFKAGVTMGNNPDPYNKAHKQKMKQLKNKKKR